MMNNESVLINRNLEVGGDWNGYIKE